MARAGERPYSRFRSQKARDRYLAHCALLERDWPEGSECRTLDGEYGATFVRVDGPADATPLVLLPGATTNSLCWTNAIGVLSTCRRTYAVDAIYDAGRSVPTRPLTEPAHMTSWLDGVLDALGLTGPVDLGGLSYGAYAVGEYLLHAPHRVRRAVLVSPAMTVAPISRAFVRRALPMLFPVRSAYVSFAGWVMPYMVTEDPAKFEQLVDELLLARRCYGRMALPGGRALTDEELAGISVPVLYLCGDRDGVCEDAAEVAAYLTRMAPGIRTHLIEGAAHDAVAVRAAEVADAMLDFLEAPARLPI